jgi:glycosyltransferase involved in cell wall biosynthesis
MNRHFVPAPLRIAQHAPPWFPIPPVGYGGIEIVVNDLTNGLVALGHDVHLIAPGDSRTDAALTPSVPRHLGLDHTLAAKADLIARVTDASYRALRALPLDLLHDHTDEPVPADFPLPVVRTIHGPALPAFVRKYATFSARGDAFVAISRRQRELFEDACATLLGDRGAIRFVGTVHNPLDVRAIPFGDRAGRGDFAFFMGRCDAEKSPDGALRIARAAGLPLVLALRINAIERPYFEHAVRPLLGPDVTLLPELNAAQKYAYMGRAKVVIFSSQWEEPFGMVLTEAMACGAPVVALARGASPELVIDGVTGFLGGSEEALAATLRRVDAIDPAACRRHVAANFHPRLIAARYVAAYRHALAARVPGGAPLECAAD